MSYWTTRTVRVVVRFNSYLIVDVVIKCSMLSRKMCVRNECLFHTDLYMWFMFHTRQEMPKMH